MRPKKKIREKLNGYYKKKKLFQTIEPDNQSSL
jgi:hypothetical protein